MHLSVQFVEPVADEFADLDLDAYVRSAKGRSPTHTDTSALTVIATEAELLAPVEAAVDAAAPMLTTASKAAPVPSAGAALADVAVAASKAVAMEAISLIV